jgi:hypothetical protein
MSEEVDDYPEKKHNNRRSHSVEDGACDEDTTG